MQEALANFFKFDIPGETIVSLIIIAIMIIVCFIIFIKCKLADPLKRPKGLLLIAEWAVEKVDAWVLSLMGPHFSNFGGYFLAIFPYVFLSFIIGVTGLPSPMGIYCTPLSLSLILFVLIHATSIRYTKWSYFKRYIDPFPPFLPINLISMWSPLLSTSLRMFGNAVSGWVILGLVYNTLNTLSFNLFHIPGLSIAPIPAVFLHGYFDCFGAYIQTLVFCSLSALFIAQERPDDIDVASVDYRHDTVKQ